MYQRLYKQGWNFCASCVIVLSALLAATVSEITISGAQKGTLRKACSVLSTSGSSDVVRVHGLVFDLMHGHALTQHFMYLISVIKGLKEVSMIYVHYYINV